MRYEIGPVAGARPRTTRERITAALDASSALFFTAALFATLCGVLFEAALGIAVAAAGVALVLGVIARMLGRLPT